MKLINKLKLTRTDESGFSEESEWKSKEKDLLVFCAPILDRLLGIEGCGINKLRLTVRDKKPKKAPYIEFRPHYYDDEDEQDGRLYGINYWKPEHNEWKMEVTLGGADILMREADITDPTQSFYATFTW
jgi:hypothetical protein